MRDTADLLAELALFLDKHPKAQFTTINTIAHFVHFRADNVSEFTATKEAIWQWLNARPTWIEDTGYQIAAWAYDDYRIRLYGRKDMPMTED